MGVRPLPTSENVTTRNPPVSVECREDLPVYREIPGHYRPTPFLLTSDMYGGLPLELAGGEISDKVGEAVAAPHTHEVPEIYVLTAPAPGEARIKVVIDGQEQIVTAPATVFVPAGAVHHFITLAASRGSACYGILLTSTPLNPTEQDQEISCGQPT